MCLRRAIDRSKVDLGWHRCLPEHCLSTLGLLAVLAKGGSVSRGSAPREAYTEALGRWLKEYLGGLEFKLPLPLEPASSKAFTFPGVLPPSPPGPPPGPVRLVERFTINK